MDTIDRATGIASACENTFKQLQAFSTENLIRKQELGKASSFEPLLRTLDSVFETLGLVGTLDLKKLDVATLQLLQNALSGMLSGMLERMERLSKYKPIGPTAPDREPAMNAFIDERRQQIERISFPLALALHRKSPGRMSAQVES